MDHEISEQERRRRADIVARARLALELEGWRSGDATRALQDAYVRGEVDLDEVVAHAQSAGTVTAW